MLKAYYENRPMNNPSTQVSPERSIKGLLNNNDNININDNNNNNDNNIGAKTKILG